VEKYECILRDKVSGNRWSMTFQAEDFAHAEEQCKDATTGDEIITITKDYVSHEDRRQSSSS
jgi:hypothetical protein